MVVHVGAKSTIEPPDSLVLLLLALLLFWSALAQPVNSLLYLHFTFAWLISFKTIKIFPTGKAQRAIITSVFKLQGWTYSRGVLSLYWFLFENLSWSGCLCECVLEENWGKKKRESLNGLKFLKLSEAFFCCQMNQRNLHLQGGWIPFCSTLLLMPSEIFYCSLLVDLAADLPELWETAGSAKEPLGADNTRNCLSFGIFFVCSTPLWSCALSMGYIANQLLCFVSQMAVRDLFIELPLMLLLVSSWTVLLHQICLTVACHLEFRDTTLTWKAQALALSGSFLLQEIHDCVNIIKGLKRKKI